MRKTGILYRDIAADLKNKIFNNSYPLNNLIPTEDQLSDEYDVSKITIKKAVDILVAEGYLNKQSGKGTFVISNRPFNKLSRADSFTSILESEGCSIEKEILNINEVLSGKIFDQFPDTVFKISEINRLYKLDKKKYIFFTHYISLPIECFNQNQLDSQSLYQVMNQNNITIRSFKDSFSVDSSNEKIVKLLDLQMNDSYLKRIRKTYDSFDNLVEYSIGYYNTSLHPYDLNYEI